MLRANPFLTFLNIVAIIYFTSELILTNKQTLTLASLILSPFITLTSTLKTKIKLQKVNVKFQKIKRLIPSLLVSIITLSIIVPLLASANPLFEEIVDSIFNFDFIRKFFTENFFLNVARLFIFSGLLYIIPRLIVFANKKIGRQLIFAQSESTGLIQYAIPKIATIMVLLVFFYTQMQLYLSNTDTLIQIGVTNSQYAREVFGQLSVVTLIAFLLIYADRDRNRINKISSYFLIIELIFLNFMALKSVNDYVTNWGYTHKRLYGYAVVCWLFALLVAFLYTHVRNKERSHFLRKVILITGITLFMINVSNFDKLIYHHAKSTTHHGIDYFYLGMLSPDSASYSNQMDILKDVLQKEDIDTKNSPSGAATILVSKTNRLKESYEKFDYRIFNFARYKEYQRIKDYDTDKLEIIIKQHYNMLDEKSRKEREEKLNQPSASVVTQTKQKSEKDLESTQIVLSGLPADLYNSYYFLEEVQLTNKPLIPNGADGNLSENILIHSGEPGTYYLYLVGIKQIDERTTHAYHGEVTFTVTKNNTPNKRLIVNYR